MGTLHISEQNTLTGRLRTRSQKYNPCQQALLGLLSRHVRAVRLPAGSGAAAARLRLRSGSRPPVALSPAAPPAAAGAAAGRRALPLSRFTPALAPALAPPPTASGTCAAAAGAAAARRALPLSRFTPALAPPLPSPATASGTCAAAAAAAPGTDLALRGRRPGRSTSDAGVCSATCSTSRPSPARAFSSAAACVAPATRVAEHGGAMGVPNWRSSEGTSLRMTRVSGSWLPLHAITLQCYRLKAVACGPS